VAVTVAVAVVVTPVFTVVGLAATVTLVTVQVGVFGVLLPAPHDCRTTLIIPAPTLKRMRLRMALLTTS
jgi:hypothetical protein